VLGVLRNSSFARFRLWIAIVFLIFVVFEKVNRVLSTIQIVNHKNDLAFASACSKLKVVPIKILEVFKAQF